MNDLTFGQISAVMAALVAFLGSATYIKKLVTAPFEEINSKLDKINQDLSIQKKAELNLLRQSLLKSSNDYIKSKEISMDELESLNLAYESYHELGGDSFITALVEKCNKLNLKEK